jgi:hypothetical protein
MQQADVLSVGNPEEKTPLGKLGIYGRIIL